MSGLGTALDAMYTLDQKIHSAEKVVRDLKAKRATSETKLLDQMKKQGLKGAKGLKCVAIVSEYKSPTIKNAKKFWRYVRANDAFELVQNRISSRAYFDRIEEGADIPGIEVFKRRSISLRKRK